jgi:hypothetical protein
MIDSLFLLCVYGMRKHAGCCAGRVPGRIVEQDALTIRPRRAHGALKTGAF